MANRTLLLGYVVDGELPRVTKEDAEKLTHINIAFGTVKDGLLCHNQLKHMDNLNTIRAYNPQIKIILSVGGWGAGGFSTMAMTEEARRAFAASVKGYMDAHALDGVDIDWEYPCSSSAGIDSDPKDRENFTALLQALRDAVGEHKIVSIAAGAGYYFVRDTEMEKVAAICDYVQLMTYDMRSGFCRQAGHHTSLYASEGDETDISTDHTVNMFHAAGVPLDKIVIGAAFYSRMWDGVPNVNHGLLQQAESLGNYGPGYTKLAREYIDQNGYTRYWDDAACAPFLYNGHSLISYDDPRSVTLKCEYLLHKGLRGIMYWEHGCDPSRELLAAMSAALRA